MALSATALTTLAKAGSWLGIDPTDFVRPGFKVYHDGTGAATTATVAVTAATISFDSSVVGQDHLLVSLTAGATDTLAELLAVPLVSEGWIITNLYIPDAASTDLVITAATDCFGAAAEVTINIEDNRGLELIIEGVSAEIQTWLGRHILSASYTETIYLEPGECDLGEVVLNEPDVTGVNRLAVDTLHGLNVSYTGASPRATIEVTDTSVIQRSRTGSTTTTTTTTFVAQATLTAMAAAIAAVAGWSASVPSGLDGNTPSEYLVRSAAISSKSVTVQLFCWEDFGGDYVVNYDPGIATLNVRTWPASSRERVCCSWPRRLQVAYTAGFATVPFDVEQVALQMIQSEFNRRGSDDTLASESLEGYSYSRQLGNSAEAKEWQQRLARYQRVLP